MAEEFYSFDKVLRELQMEEEELKKLVSEGEIRAFRDEDKMKFKREDIERFRVGGTDLPTIDAPTNELTDADLFGDDDGGSGDIGMVTQQISSDPTFLDDVDAFDEVESAPEPRRGGGGRKSAGRASTASRPARRRTEVETAGEGIGMQIALVLGALALLYGMAVAFNAVEVQSSGLTKGWANWVNDTFMKPS